MNIRVKKDAVMEIFNISSATLDNWVKNEIPESCVDGLYDLKILYSFVKENNKLSKRANKKQNKKLEIPKDLLDYLVDKNWITGYVNYLLKQEDFSVVAKDLLDLYKSRLLGSDFSGDLNLLNVIPEGEFYAYSVAYQILLTSGEKSMSGSYYTPKFIVKDLIKSVIGENKKLLEPCCGVGFFCVEYIKEYISLYGKFPSGLIFANDINYIASEITRLNIIALTVSNTDEIWVSNKSIFELSLNDMDIVLTNPPYGIKNSYIAMKTTEIFSHCVHISLEKFLSNDGELLFVLPQSVLAVDKHKELRVYLLNNHHVLSVIEYGKSFDGVFSDIVALRVKKNKRSLKDNSLLWIKANSTESVPFEAVYADYKFVRMNRSDWDKIKSLSTFPSILLKSSVFGMGIVTGNNEKFISNEYKDGYIPIVSGKEVYPGYIKFDDCKYILNDLNNVQQKPPLELFKETKIVYKFISSKIVSAVDRSGALTLNSANFLILKDFAFEPEYVSAIFNSKIFNLFYSKRNGNPIKILKSDLELSPIFVFKEDIRLRIKENYLAGLHHLNDEIIESQLIKDK